MGTWAAGRGHGFRRLARAVLAASWVAGLATAPQLAHAQSASDPFAPPRPPADIPSVPPAASPPPANVGPPTPLLPSAPVSPAPPPVVNTPTPPPAPAAPTQVSLAVSARFGRDPPVINGGLLWRVYPDKPDPGGTFRLIKEDRGATPTFMLPPGGYVVHVTFGLANAVKRVQLRAEPVREIFEIAAGGARFEGRVGDSKIPVGQISFDVYPGSQFEPGEKRRVAQDVATGDVVLLPEGAYYVVWQRTHGAPVASAHLAPALAGARGFCARLTALVAAARAHGARLVAAERPAAISIAVRDLARRIGWGRTPYGLVMSRPAALRVGFSVPAAGTWDVYLAGEFSPPVDLRVDGRAIATIEGQLGGNSLVPNITAPVPVTLGAGSHVLVVSRRRGSLAPGDGGAALLDRIYLAPSGAPARTLVTLDPRASAAQLCSRPYAWVESLPPARA